MARLRVRGYLVNDSIVPDCEISPQELIDKLIGNDTGAALETASFVLDTDDGYCVTISVPVPRQPRKGPQIDATEMRAVVHPKH
jgi:hypothetical protein